MKQNLRLLMMTLLCAVTSVVWGQTVTDELTAADLAATSTTYTDFSGVKKNTAVYAGQSAKDSSGNIQLRSKNSNSGIVSTTSGGTLKSVTVTVASGTNQVDVYGSNTAYTNATDLYATTGNTNQGTLIGSLTETGTITVEGEYEYVGIRSHQDAIYLSKIEIVWDAPVEKVATPTFSLAGGTYYESQPVTINCNTDGATIYYTTDGTEPTEDSSKYDSTITIDETTTIKAIAIDGEGNKSRVATVTYTIEEIDALASLVELSEQTTEGNYFVNLENAVVTYTNGNYAYIEDNSGAILLFKSGHGLTAGQTLNGLAQVAFEVRYGNPQITNLSGNYEVTDGTAPEPYTYPADEWDTTIEETLSQYLKITGATITKEGSNYYVQLGEEKVQLYGREDAKTITVEHLDDTYTIIGFPTLYEKDGNTIPELYIFVQPRPEGTSSKTDPNLAFSQENVEVKLGETFTAPTLTNDEGVDVTYTSSNTAVATVNAETGVVTIVAVGTTTITAASVESDDYYASSASYTLKVTDDKGTTEEKAYTVAEARDAIDNGGNMTGVYAKGIVSEIVTAYNSQYGNISYNISDDGTETSAQLQAYRGKSYEGANFTSADDIQVGDVVVIYGNLIKYKDTYEFAENNQLVSLERSMNPIIKVEDQSLTLAYDATSGEIAYTITNPVTGTVLTAATEAEWISNVTVADDKVTFTTTANKGEADRTATITLSYEGATAVAVTVTQKHYEVDYATLPFAFDGDNDNIATTTGLTGYGLGDYTSSPKLKFDNTGDYLILKINERPGKLTFDIKGNGFSGGTFTLQASADGENYTDVKTYTSITSTQSEEISQDDFAEDIRYIKWIYTKKSSGNVALGNIKLAKYSNLINPNLSFDQEEYTANYGEEFTTPTLNNEYGVSVTYTSSDTNVATVDAATGAITLIAEGTTTITAKSEADETYDAGSASYTLNYVVTLEDNKDVFVLVSENDLAAGDEIIIVNVTTTAADETADTEASTSYIGMSTTQNKNNRGQISVNANADGTLKGNNKLQVITLEAATETDTETSEVTTWRLNVGNGYLYAAGGTSSNYLKTEEEPDNNGNADAAITINEEGIASIVFQGTATRNTLQYNSSNKLFSCYASSQQDVKIYRKRTILLGDANNDGGVNVSDVMLTVNYILKGADAVPTFNYKNANVNGDTTISIADVMAIVRIAMGK